MAKLTTWLLANAVPTINAKASALTDTAMTITADSIVKNGKPTDGKVIHLTVAHLRQPDFAFAMNAKTGVATVKRSEGKRGRRGRSATPEANLTAFLNRFAAAATVAPSAPESVPATGTAS
jgi:hypothetical protein